MLYPGKALYMHLTMWKCDFVWYKEIRVITKTYINQPVINTLLVRISVGFVRKLGWQNIINICLFDSFINVSMLNLSTAIFNSCDSWTYWFLMLTGNCVVIVHRLRPCIVHIHIYVVSLTPSKSYLHMYL